MREGDLQAQGDPAAVGTVSIAGKHHSIGQQFAGLVSRWVMPSCRQIRSKSTSAGRGAPNRPVNWRPLSVNTSSGTPYSAIAVIRAVHTARALARGTTVAMTEYREWSSIPEISLASVTPPDAAGSVIITEPMMSSCHSCIGASVPSAGSPPGSACGAPR